MKCIDFDARFNKYLQKWIDENRSKYRKVDDMEDAMPEVYLKWINMPADWLDGQTPALYFAQFDDADMLCKWMLKYINSGIALPDQLLDRIAELGEASVDPLMEIAFDRRQPEDARMHAMGALQQIQSHKPMNALIQQILHAHQDEDELANLCAEMLTALGVEAKEPVIAAMSEAKPEKGLILLETACNFPRDERTYDYAVELLKKLPEKRALIASYLGKIGDERAIEALMPLLESEEINYLDYLEIKGAIEELGGEVTADRDFSGDEYYESMRNL